MYSNAYQYAKNGFETTVAFDCGGPGWTSVTGFAISSYARYLDLVRSGSYKLLEPLNVKYVVSDRELDSKQLQFLGTYGDEFLYLNERFVSRVQPTTCAILIVCSDQGVWEGLSAGTMAQPSFDPRGMALVWGGRLRDFSLDELKRFAVVQIPDQTFDEYESDARKMLDDYVKSGGIVVASGDPVPDSLLARFAALQGGVVLRVNRYTPNRMDVDVRTEASGVVQVSEVYIPGWRAWVDGREVEILRVDGIFFGFFLEEGVHSLVIEFRPLAFDGAGLLCAISYVGLVLALFPARVRAILGRLMPLSVLRRGVSKPI
jgi:hypothetical protein